MVKDTILYDILGVESNATEIELKKAYRKQAIRLHPDKNGNDPNAAKKFQELGEAYGILKDNDKRAIYDELGKEGMESKNLNNEAADIDPAEFFSTVFGGESFKDWIGELSMLQDLSKAAEVLEEQDVDTATEADAGVSDAGKKMDELAIKEDTINTTSKTTPLTTEAINKKKNQKITKDQREEIRKLHEESRANEEKRVNELVEKLLTKLEKYDLVKDNVDSLESFKRSLGNEFEDMKIESFGLQILHLIGTIYKDQANARLLSSKTLGVSKIFTNAKSTAKTVKNGYSIIKTAVDAQMSMEKMVAEQEELQKKPELTQEDQIKLASMERLIVGKFLATAWASTKFEVTGVLNKVCNKLLNDKSLGRKERNQRAKSLYFIGEMMTKVERTEEEAEDARVFEAMMAEANTKQKKSKKPFDEKEFEKYMAKFAEEKEASEQQ